MHVPGSLAIGPSSAMGDASGPPSPFEMLDAPSAPSSPSVARDAPKALSTASLLPEAMKPVPLIAPTVVPLVERVVGADVATMHHPTIKSAAPRLNVASADRWHRGHC